MCTKYTASEKQLQKVSAEIDGDSLLGEAAPFYFPMKFGIDIRPSPLVFVPDLVSKIVQVLEQNERYMSNPLVHAWANCVVSLYMHTTSHTNQFVLRTNWLTWHEGLIPLGEIWVKIGGDKGGKSMKASFQVCNVPRSNSVQNTFVFAVFEAQDSRTNLHITIDRYREQIKILQ